jgi:hypothetical protein
VTSTLLIGGIVAGASTVRFLNIDVVIAGRFDRGPVLQALGDKVFALHEDAMIGRQRCLVLELVKERKDPSKALEGLLDWVEHLPRAARGSWAEASRRVFDIGIQAGATPHETHWSIPPGLIARIAEVGGEVVLTVYGAHPRRGWQRPEK